MGRFPTTANGISQRALNYLVPAALQDDPQSRLHAGRTVTFGVAMVFWAPVFAPIYFMLGSPHGAVMIGCAAGAVVLSLLSMRWTKSVWVTGNLIAASVFCLLIGLAVISGGIQAASVSWLPAVAIIGLILCGRGAGIAWALACCLACLMLLDLPRLGVVPANDIPVENQQVLDFAATSGIVLCAFSLTYLFKVSEATTHRALELACTQSEQASRAKSTFLANMSHEIRTPLNAVLGMAELMRDGPLTRQQEEYLKIAQDSGDALLALVDDILDFSRSKAGKLVLARKRFDLHESLLRSLKALAVQAHGQGLELVCHIDPIVPRHVVGDPARLRQIVLNLVGNAIKFTEQGDVVFRVRLEAQTQDTITVHFAVTDTGIGIPEDRQAVIFDVFEQVDMSSTRRFGGVGLGLAISSHLVHRMGGKIHVTSEVGHGSVFEFTATFGQADQDAPPTAGPLDGQRILVVEDHATTHQILKEMLCGLGVQTDVAAHADEAVDLITRSVTSRIPYELVLLESSLGDGEGVKLAEQIQHITAWKGPVLLMLTCDQLPESVARCRQIGIRDYLVKPIGRWELLDAIRAAIRTPSRKVNSQRAREASDGPERPLKVLLVEDSLVNQKLATAMVTKLGHDVVVANNGREALTAWESQDFDLILMDVQMPEMDGLQATRVIRDRERQTDAHIPIIAVTAHVLPEDQQQCFAAGMDKYMSKPIKLKSLVAAIESVQ